MTPTEKQVKRRVISGISVRTTNEKEMSPESAKIATLWQRFYQGRLNQEIPNQISDTPVYGVYSSYESDVTGEYTLTAGVEVEDRVDISPGFSKVEIAEGKYLVFDGKGSMPRIVFDTWGRIWNFFSSDTRYERAYTTDFEVYAGQDQISIHIAVKLRTCSL